MFPKHLVLVWSCRQWILHHFPWSGNSCIDVFLYARYLLHNNNIILFQGCSFNSAVISAEVLWHLYVLSIPSADRNWAATATNLLRCFQLLLTRWNNEGDVNPNEFFIGHKSVALKETECTGKMSIIPHHYLYSNAPTPEITLLHNILHSSRHNWIALSVQIS